MTTYVPGGADLIDIMGGGIPDDSARQWLAQKSEMVRSTLSTAGQVFFEKARSLYDIVSESQALQMLRNLKGRSDDVWSSNQISYLHTLEQLQTAGPIMQRWIMAEPELRTRYIDQTVDGYSDTYVNYHGDVVGDRHYDYRRVMTGVVQVEEDRDFIIQHFSDYMSEDEKELDFYQKIDILNTWDKVRHYLEEGGEDPTSVYGAQL